MTIVGGVIAVVGTILSSFAPSITFLVIFNGFVTGKYGIKRHLNEICPRRFNCNKISQNIFHLIYILLQIQISRENVN